MISKTLMLFGVFCTVLLLWNNNLMAASSHNRIYKGNDSSVRYVGRYEVSKEGAVSFDWAGTFLETSFSGGKVWLKITETGTSFYNVFVDSKLHKVVKVCGVDTIINIVTGIDSKWHRLRIQKRTEGEFGRTTIQQFILAKGGFLARINESVLRKRHIEFIGNSLTCGYGSEGMHKDDPFRLETENCNLSFSCIIARYFNADYTLIAHSGRGAVRNYGDSVRISSVTMKDKMLQTFDESSAPLWNFASYRPDLLVINLGTNDFSLEPHPYKSEFLKAYTQILKQIRKNYGDVPILCIYSCTIPAPVFNYYEEAVTLMHDKNIHLLKLKDDLFNESMDYGAAAHPNYSGHRKIAMNLIPSISTILGWKITDKSIE